jgi:hypothetical protein
MTALAVVLALAVVSRATDEASRSAQADDPSAVSAVFDSIETAWQAGDARGLVASFAPGRVLLRLPGNASQAPGHFSHQQCLLILGNLFESNVVRRFQFEHRQAPEVVPGKAVGLATVSWRKLGVGRTKEGRMLVVLERSAAGWGVSEMQALP